MKSITPRLHPRLAAIEPELIIFDKDGTLINFHTMWGKWIRVLARRLEAATYQPIAATLFEAMGFDPKTGHIEPDGKLAVTPMTDLQILIQQVLKQANLSDKVIDVAMITAWCNPDEVAQPESLTDLSLLFGTLQHYGLKIAIATSDDHAPTQTMIDQWQLTPLVDMIIGADDGLPIKPAPDVVNHICQTLNISPHKTIMVGDNVVDLQMGRAAKVDLTVGVLTGVSPEADLHRWADLILPTIQAIIQPV